MRHGEQCAVSQVMARITISNEPDSGSIASVVKKVAMVLAPSWLAAYQQMSLARTAAKAILDGTCVFLFAGMLCYHINVS